MGDLRRLDALLRADEGDAGCAAGEEILDAYVELELAGEDPARVYPGTAIHLQSCPGCRADHDGLLEAARRFGHVKPEQVADSRPGSGPSRRR
jgi:predicted anti-sigma-YlaC factor YlaD